MFSATVSSMILLGVSIVQASWNHCQYFTSVIDSGANVTALLYEQLTRVERVLHEQHVPHLMVYGTLLGLERAPGTLNPYEKNLDIAVPDTYNVTQMVPFFAVMGLHHFFETIPRLCFAAPVPHNYSAPWFHQGSVYYPYTDLYPVMNPHKPMPLEIDCVLRPSRRCSFRNTIDPGNVPSYTTIYQPLGAWYVPTFDHAYAQRWLDAAYLDWRQIPPHTKPYIYDTAKFSSSNRVQSRRYPDALFYGLVLYLVFVVGCIGIVCLKKALF
jgi:hypothetical protein